MMRFISALLIAAFFVFPAYAQQSPVENTGGVASVAGTANQITVSSATGAVTLSLPSALQPPGTIALGGCTIGTDALCVTGTASLGNVNVTGATVPTTGVYLDGSALGVSQGSTERMRFSATTLASLTTGGPTIRYGAASCTTPAFAPSNSASTTGFSGDGTKLCGVINGTDAIDWSPTAGEVVNGATLGASSTASFLTVTGTWNDAGTAFKGALLVNVTNTNSATNSMLGDFQVGGVSEFNIRKDGTLTANGGINTNTNFGVSTTGSVSWNTRGKILSPADSTWTLASSNNSLTVVLSAPGTAVLQLGALDVDTGPIAQTMRTQGALAGGTSNVAGANWTFIASPGKGTGAGGSFIFQTAPAGSSGTVVNTPVTALTIDSTKLSTFAGQINVAAMTQTSVAQSGTVCYNSGTGAVTYDATLGCLTSLPEYKDFHGQIHGAFDELVQIKSYWISWKHSTPEWKGGDREIQPAFNAREIARIDRRLVSYGPDGKLRGVRYAELVAFLAAALNDAHDEITALHTANDNEAAELRSIEARLHRSEKLVIP